jgi:CheY-like chemotaxis protein
MNLPATILLAEDLPDDVFLFERALSKAGIHNPLQVVTDGEQAIAYLTGLGRFHDRVTYPLPFLIVLDLKMPYRNGFEVLAWIKSHPTLFDLPCIVLSSSAQKLDQVRAYNLGARSYLIKPLSAQDFLDLASSMDSFFIPKLGISPFVLTKADKATGKITDLFSKHPKQ